MGMPEVNARFAASGTPLSAKAQCPESRLRRSVLYRPSNPLRLHIDRTDRRLRHSEAIGEQPQQQHTEHPRDNFPGPKRGNAEEPRFSARVRGAEKIAAEQQPRPNGEEAPAERGNPGDRPPYTRIRCTRRSLGEKVMKPHAMLSLRTLLRHEGEQ